MATNGKDGTGPTEGGARISRLNPETDVTLEHVERQRAHLWTVAAVFILVSSITVAVALSAGRLDEILPDSPALQFALIGLGVAFVLYVVDQERNLRRLTRALFDAEILAASLRSRVQDLTTLSRVGQLVNSVLTMEEVLEVLLDAVFELTEAAKGSVLFLEDEKLRVAVSAGTNAAPRGVTVDRDRGIAGWVVTNREPLLITGRLDEDQFPGHQGHQGTPGSSISAPMMAGDDLIGVLSVERSPDSEPFNEVQLRSVSLFAAQAATAVMNARRYEEQRRTAEELADALERRSEFVATLVHELKTPLTAIVGFSNLLIQRAQDLSQDMRDQMVTSVRDQAERLRLMVEEVLRVASADAGAELSRAPVDLEEVVRASAANVRGVAVAREGTKRDIEIAIEADLPQVYGDRDALERITQNLLENAVKYSPAGSSIEVEVTSVDSGVQLSVTDHGDGIAKEELEDIFERFRRVTRGKESGVGLGLYIVRSLVAAHGGEVWAESEVGTGSTFYVSLPVRRSNSSRNGTSVPAESSEARVG